MRVLPATTLFAALCLVPSRSDAQQSARQAAPGGAWPRATPAAVVRD